jgi:ribosome-binding protein aMBF1 (putative translation factor)
MTESSVTISMNCQVCGNEFFENELKTIKLSGFESSIVSCDSCLAKTAEDSFKDAADILKDIVKIAASSKDPEKRLRAIRSLLGE